MCENHYDHIEENGHSNEEVMNTWNDALEIVTSEVWSNCVRHSDEIIPKYWKDQVRYKEQQELIIDIGERLDEGENLFLFSDKD